MNLIDLVSISPKSKIGDVEILAAFEEIHSDSLQVTDHPVERGPAISDHAFKRPTEVVIKCGWSNSTLSSMLSKISSLLGDGTKYEVAKFSGEMSRNDYVSSVYSKLLAIQESREPITLATSKRIYSDMLITSIQVTTDQRSNDVLMVTATLRQVIIVETRSTTLPSKDKQATPESTAEVTNTGSKQVVEASPVSGGAVSPEEM